MDAEIEAPPIRALTPDDISSIYHLLSHVPRFHPFFFPTLPTLSIGLVRYQTTLKSNIRTMRASDLVGATLFGLVTAHGDHVKTGGAPEVPADANWMTKHMAGR